METIVSWIVNNLTMVRFGWWTDVMNNTNDWKNIGILFIIISLAYFIFNILSFISHTSFIFRNILISIGYGLLNIIILFLITLIGISVGEMIGLLIVWAIWIILSIFIIAFENSSSVDTIFGIFDYLVNWTDDYQEWKYKTKKWKEKYNKLLNY